MSAHYCIGNPCRICHPEFYPEPKPFTLPPSMPNKELIAALDEYIELLGAEIRDLSSFAATHGIESTRVEAGKELRERIARLRVSDRSGTPQATEGSAEYSEERGPRHEGDAQEPHPNTE